MRSSALAVVGALALAWVLGAWVRLRNVGVGGSYTLGLEWPLRGFS